MRAAVFLLPVISYLLFVFPAQAQTPACQPIFGGGESCVTEGNLLIDKKLRAPNSNQFVDGTKLTDPKFAPGQTVLFQLTLRNTGNRVIEDITVIDTFPRFVSFVKGPGQFNRATNTLTFSVDKLEAGQNRVIAIEGKVAAANTIPGTNTVSCIVNQATATQGRNRATDNTEFCLQKGAQPAIPTPTKAVQPGVQAPTPSAMPPIYEAPDAKTTPSTGPELLGLLGLLPAGVGGFYLRKIMIK